MLAFLSIWVVGCSGNYRPVTKPLMIDSSQHARVSDRLAVPTNDFVIYDNLRQQVVTASASPYVVGQHLSLTAESKSGRALSNISWSVGSAQIVSSYQFLVPAPGNTAPATMTFQPAPTTVQATSIAFYPVFAGNTIVEANATVTAAATPAAVSTTVVIPVVAPSVQPTWQFENPWSVDKIYAYASPKPPPRTLIHLGGAKTTPSAQGFVSKFSIVNPAATIPGNYSIVQLIVYCGSTSDLTIKSTARAGTKGPVGVLDTLDGHIVLGNVNLANQPSFSILYQDSPAYNLLNPNSVTDQQTGLAQFEFETIPMYQYGVNSDSTAPNIWVPLGQSETWTWAGAAGYNIQDASNTWEQAGPAPTVASSFPILNVSVPVWSYEQPFYGDQMKEGVTACQI